MRTSEQILESLLADGRIVAPSISWVPKSPQVDLMESVTGEASRLYTVMDYIRGITTLAGIESLTRDTAFQQSLANIFGVTTDQVMDLLENDLDNIAEREGFTGDLGGRKAAKAAVGVAQLLFASAAPATVPVGTRLRTSTSDKFFTTLDPITNVTPVADSSGRLSVYCMVQAEVAGTAGNLVRGTRLNAVGSVTGLTGIIIPYEITNGRDKENNLEYVERLRSMRESRGVGTKSFYSGLLLQDARVYDIVMYGVTDNIATPKVIKFNRAYGLDIWVHAAETSQTVTEVVPNPARHYPRLQPLVDESAIITGGFTRVDPNNEYLGSVLASSYAQGTSGNIQYFTDRTIRDLQTKIEDPDFWIIGGRSVVLVKKAIKKKIDIKADIYISAGYDWADVMNTVSIDLQAFFYGGTTSNEVIFSRKKIAESIQWSDILNIILDVEGVDRVKTSTFELRKNGVKTTDPVVFKYNEYSALGNLVVQKMEELET